MKTLEKYASGMDPHKFYFALELLNSVDCFCVCEYSLWCRHNKYQIDIFVFKDMHSQRYNGFSKLITKDIRRHL